MLQNILAIETSAAVCSVALLSNCVVYEQEKAAQRDQSQLILPFIDELLTKANINVSELSAIALAIGPGSFTGIRLGVSVTQGLSISTGVPVLAISSLRAIAQGVFQEFQHKHVLVCVNAYMDEVYFAKYSVNTAGIMQLVGDEQLVKPEVLILPNNLEDWVGVGNGWAAYSNSFSVKPSMLYVDYLPHAKNLLTLAQTADQQSALKAIDEIVPTYLRSETAWHSQVG